MKHIKYIRTSRATGLVKKAYDEMNVEFLPVGSLPGGDPATLHSLQPEILDAWWLALRETIVIEDKLSRVMKEAVCSTISLANDCPYCLDSHTAVLAGLGNRNIAKAIATCDLSLDMEPDQKEIIAWALNQYEPESENILNPPFTENEAPEIIGSATMFNYVNRIVQIFLGKSILPIYMESLKGLINTIVVNVGAFAFRKQLKHRAAPGSIRNRVTFLTNEFDVEWSLNNPRISAAWLHFHETVEKKGAEYIPINVSQAFQAVLKQWSSKELLGKTNFREYLEVELDVKEYSLANYLCKVAFSPDKISEADFKILRRINLDKKEIGGSTSDECLLTITCWASLKTALRVSQWLSQPVRGKKGAVMA